MTENQKLREALQEAATSLESISRLAGRGTYPNGDDTYMGTFMEVRGYATSRAGVARQALATTEPAVNQQLTTEPVDEREAFEKWATPKRFDVGHKGEDGSYLGRATSIAWEAWQARAAMAKGVKG